MCLLNNALFSRAALSLHKKPYVYQSPILWYLKLRWSRINAIANCSGGENKQVQRAVWCSVSELSSELLYICVFTQCIVDVMMSEDCVRLAMHIDVAVARCARLLARPPSDPAQTIFFIFCFQLVTRAIRSSHSWSLFCWTALLILFVHFSFGHCYF